MSSPFQVTLVVAGLDLGNANLDRLFGLLPDAVPAAIGNLVTVSAPVEAPDAESACLALADILTAAFPDATPVRVDQDLVSIPDIAERTGRSRESIRLLVDGKRGPGSFPPPVGIVGNGTRVWPWAVVIDWFASALGADLGERGIDPVSAAAVDVLLATRLGRPAATSQVA